MHITVFSKPNRIRNDQGTKYGEEIKTEGKAAFACAEDA
jgi:hypothetical protein